MSTAAFLIKNKSSLNSTMGNTEVIDDFHWIYRTLLLVLMQADGNAA